MRHHQQQPRHARVSFLEDKDIVPFLQPVGAASALEVQGSRRRFYIVQKISIAREQTEKLENLYSSSLDSSSSSFSCCCSCVAFFGFFFFFLFLPLEPVDLANGCSRIFKISSSSIFLSDLNLERSRVGGAASLVIPFFVMAVRVVSRGKNNSSRMTSNTHSWTVQRDTYRWWSTSEKLERPPNLQ